MADKETPKVVVNDMNAHLINELGVFVLKMKSPTPEQLSLLLTACANCPLHKSGFRYLPNEKHMIPGDCTGFVDSKDSYRDLNLDRAVLSIMYGENGLHLAKKVEEEAICDLDLTDSIK